MPFVQGPNSPLTLVEEHEEHVETHQAHRDQTDKHQERSVEPKSRPQLAPHQDLEPLPEHEPHPEHEPQSEHVPWIGGNGYNFDANIIGSTSGISNRNIDTERRHSVSKTTASAGQETIRHTYIPAPGTPPRSNRGQVQLLALRPAASGFSSYDPVRGDNTFQPLYLPHWNDYDGRGDAVVGLNRNTSSRAGVPGPRSVTSPTDLTMVENGSAAWSGSRGEDLLVGVPVVEEPRREKTVKDRLKPTVDAATAERDKYQKRSSQESVTINGSIGLQVIVGAFTTGIAASGSAHVGTAVAILGGLSTILASYLAKIRGSGEPEFSALRTRDLNSFLREVETFIMDHGDKIGTDYDKQINSFRQRFEKIITEDSRGGPGSSHPHPTTQPLLHVTRPAINGHSSAMPGAYNPYVMGEKDYARETREAEKTISALA